jgi:hypothetical protein
MFQALIGKCIALIYILIVLAIAGSLAAKRRRAPGPGTLSTHGPLFVGLLLATVLVIGSLSYLPTLPSDGSPKNSKCVVSEGHPAPSRRPGDSRLQLR